MAALAIIVEEAGGIFSDFQGVPGPFGAGGISSNRALHPKFLTAINSGKISN
jgi:histidinol-phosphatase